MFIVGLTGGIGSGKSTVAGFFASLGVPVIDADQLSREVVKPGMPALRKIAEHFGDAVLDRSGALDRAKLRQLVFKNPIERTWLESLLHPLIDQLIDQKISDCRETYCILMSPLLLETSQRDKVDRVLVVDAPEALQISRTVSRDNSSEEVVRAIMAAQTSRNGRLSAANDIIVNDQRLEHLEAEVRSLHRLYNNLAMSQSI